jgi:uncharacterized protein
MRSKLDFKKIAEIARSHGARRVRLFGSVARGDATDESDLDLLVDLDPARSLIDLVAIKQDVEELVHRKVDVVTEAAISPYIREKVLSEAALI